jgi:hypothetical protein
MGKVRYEVKKIDGKEIVFEYHKIVVHKFTIGDVEDPELYAAEPIYKWQQTDAGKFVMQHSIEDPVFIHQLDQMTFGYKFVIIAELETKKLSEFYLRFGTCK